MIPDSSAHVLPQAAAPRGGDPQAIVVNVDRPEHICFAAIPFTDEFQAISTAVLKAAGRLRLSYVRVDETQATYEFPRDVRDRIKAARVVVGVCSPDSRYNTPNPNVVYELGMAHALGKPTLILTTHPHRERGLPSDLAAVQVLGYSDDDLATRMSHLELKIREAIGDLLRRSNLLTDTSREDVTVAYARHMMLLGPDFKSILDFGKNLHQQIQTIYAGHLDSLVRGIDEIFFNDNPTLKQVGELNSRWRNYTDFYDGIAKEAFDKLEKDLKAIDRCFQELRKREDERMAPAIEKAWQFYEKAKELLRKYPTQHLGTETIISTNLATLLADKNALLGVQTQIQTLSDTAKKCMIQANRLMVNLIDILIGDDHG